MTDQEKEEYDCKRFIRGIHDTMDMLGGKWKPYILASLYQDKKKYSEILKEVPGISGKMLCRKLKEMEIDLLIQKKVSINSTTALYELTEYGQTLKPVIHVLADWGTAHREKLMSKPVIKVS